jgi:flagellar hook assembly protein FlgD
VLVPTHGLTWYAGDVNASKVITALDALYIKLRTVGSINSYPAGNWVFDSLRVTIPSPTQKDVFGLCTGDVNGSYIPTGMKEASFLSVVEEGTQTIPVEETFSYQIRSNMIANLGAMTLFMGYDNERFEVTDVTTSTSDGMKYVIEDGKVAIAWADTRPFSVKNDDPVFTLTVKAKAPVAEATQIFSVLPGSEFADPRGTKYDNFDLKMSKVITPDGSNEFTIYNYPNPFNQSTTIVYVLPESGKVRLVITDMYGKTISTLVDDTQAAGVHSVTIKATDLNLKSGVYLYRIEAAGATDTYQKINKMIFAH